MAFACVIVCMLVIAYASAAGDCCSYTLTVKNETGKKANDFHLRYKGDNYAIKDPWIITTGASDAGTPTPDLSAAATGMNVSFSGTVGANQSITISFVTDNKKLKDFTYYWTFHPAKLSEPKGVTLTPDPKMRTPSPTPTPKGGQGEGTAPKKAETPTPKPTSTPTPEPKKTVSPSTPAEPRNETPHMEQSFDFPHTTGPSGSVLGTVEDTTTGGPTGFAFARVDAQGRRTFFHSVTNGLKTFVLALAAADTAIEVGHFDQHRKWVPTARCNVGTNVPVPNTRSLRNPPANGTAIVGGESSYDRNKPIELVTRGVDPTDVRLLVDGKTENARILSASDSDVTAAVPAPPGTHTVALQTNGQTTNAVPADFVEPAVTMSGSSQIGGIKTVHFTVVGIPPDHPATCTFTVFGGAVLTGGGTQTTVPLTNGTTDLQLKNVRTGEIGVRWELHVAIPGVWD